tara:strand:+ start:1493 stop:1987 length:495 start_codon:yes stop_codon:yes gene_type:complete
MKIILFFYSIIAKMNNRNWIKKLNSHQRQHIELIDKPYIGLTEYEQHMRKTLLYAKRQYDEKKKSRVIEKSAINRMIETETNVINNSKMSSITKSKHYRNLANKLYKKKYFEQGLHFHRLCIQNMEKYYGDSHENILCEKTNYYKRLDEGNRINTGRKVWKNEH